MGAKVGALWPCFYRCGEVQKIHLGNQCGPLSLSCSLSRSASWSLPWCAALLCWWHWFSLLLTFGVKMKTGSQRRTVAGTAGKNDWTHNSSTHWTDLSIVHLQCFYFWYCFVYQHFTLLYFTYSTLFYYLKPATLLLETESLSKPSQCHVVLKQV